jgi:hypothetical protein
MGGTNTTARDAMLRRHLLLPAALLCASCSTGASTAGVSHAEVAAGLVPEEPTPEFEYDIYVGELRVLPLEPMSPMGSDVQDGVIAVSTGRELGLLGRAPGVHTVTLPTNDPGASEREVRVWVREDTAGRVSGRVNGDREMGVGELALFAPRAFQSVFVIGREHLEWGAAQREDRRGSQPLVELRARAPGLTQVIGVRNDGRIARYVYDVLPEGRLPPNANVQDLTVGGPGHGFDVKGIERVDVFDPDVVGVTSPDGWTARVEPRAPGVTPVAIFREGGGEPTIVWYRVAEAR